MSNEVMRCKLVYRGSTPAYGHTETEPSLSVNFAALWEGSTEAQQASENAIFGKMTPSAAFNGVIRNPAVLENLKGKEGKRFIVTFTEVDE